MSKPPKEPKELNNIVVKQANLSPFGTSENEVLESVDLVERVLTASDAFFPSQPEKAAIAKSEMEIIPAFEKQANAPVDAKDNEKVSSAVSFALPEMTTAEVKIASHGTEQEDKKMPPALSLPHPTDLIAQPLITTPGHLQLSTLFRNEIIDFRHGYTPRPSHKHGFTPRSMKHPGMFLTQTSVVSNRTHNSSPRNSRLPMQNSASTNRTYSSATSGSVVGYPASQESAALFNFDFTPRSTLFIPPGQKQVPTPSPLFPLSSMPLSAASGSVSLTTHAKAPPPRSSASILTRVSGAHQKRLEAVVRTNKQEIKKSGVAKTKVTKPVVRARPLVDVSAVMTLEMSAKPCSCPKTQCIKLYCECFQRGQICDPKMCKCKECLNTAAESSAKGARTKKVRRLVARKGPDVFKVRHKKTGTLLCFTRCLKKYCDCVRLGKLCDPSVCTCKNCMNISSSAQESFADITKENMKPTVLNETVDPSSTHDVKVFIDVSKTGSTVEATEV